MGNYRFRLSNMMPNAWFYKLRDMGGRGRSSNNQTILDSKKKRQPPPSSATATPPSKPKQPPPQSFSRKSYYFSRELDSNEGFCINSPSKTKHLSDTCNFPEPPRKSSKQHRGGRRTATTRSASKLVSSSVSAACSCRTTAESIWTKSDSPPEFSTSPFDSSPEAELRTDVKCLASETFDSDIIIDVDKESLTTTKCHDVAGAFDSLSELELPPIITKHAKFNDNKKRETKQRTSPTRKFPANSPGVRLRIHSPKIANRKINQANGRKSVSSRRSLSDSFAIMKSSYDPQRDFRESMVEMIVENNIRASKDLEDLLACYLCLNADEYHDLIIKVFKQIWFDLTEAAY